ncbi:MAG TPA: putative Ig domain-containing protein [Longimicrobium sp.]
MKMNRFPIRRRAALAVAAVGLAAWAAAPAQVTGETRTGWLHVVWETHGVENELVKVGLYLVDETGGATELTATPEELAPHGGVLKLNGRRMTVTGDLATAREPRGTPTLRVRSLTPRQGPLPALVGAVEGPRAYVTLVCRFPDHPIELKGVETLRTWMGSAYPGMDHFWRENSENRVNIESAFAGPFVLPQPSAAYRVDGKTSLGALLQDCTRAADPTVDFSRYSGINIQFNNDLWGASWGGGWTMSLDGQTRRWATTWMANWATNATYAHEVGHSLGLPHSSGPYTAVYDSRWDVMSGGGSNDAAVGTRVPTHTIAFHKDLLGWIPAGRRYVTGPGTSATIDLVRDALPGAQGYQVAIIPIGSSGNNFVTVEARRFAGYDAQGRLPGEAVVMHQVNMSDPESPARVVDPDRNGNPNDAGAMWVPGETWTDPTLGVSVRVISATADGFRVEISTAGTIRIATDSVLPGATIGADYSAQLTTTGAGQGAAWALLSGALPVGLTLSGTGQITGVPGQAGVFRFGVRVTDSSGFGAKEMRIDVGRLHLAQEPVLEALLGNGTLTPEHQRYLDSLGNRNGRLDVGDLRAWLIDQGMPTGG